MAQLHCKRYDCEFYPLWGRWLYLTHLHSPFWQELAQRWVPPFNTEYLKDSAKIRHRKCLFEERGVLALGSQVPSAMCRIYCKAKNNIVFFDKWIIYHKTIFWAYYQLIFSLFSRFSNKIKRGVEFRQLTRHISKIEQKIHLTLQCYPTINRIQWKKILMISTLLF